MASTNPSATSTTIPTTTPSTVVISPTNIIQHLPIKLDSYNYLLWKSQFLPLLHAYDPYGYVDGFFLCPPQFLSFDPPIENPAYTLWPKQDQIILSWIYASYIAGILDYLYKVSGIIDNLAASASPFSEQDIILGVIRGLGPEYDTFATSITARLDPMSLDDFTGL
ncbi:UBN2 domain-containing protein [Cephalotus follicularis]|uniref:UBN2 domain-containing protein n=1 Tax=Cephalotus follicularis TaxID=3775 RepID=A0A1Q3CCH7_CEPFO|nr:UBN2 domain-containing protein [Cephalotus follicularis]